MKSSSDSCKGFTLIELMIIAAVIGILSSISMINLRDARLEAARAACQANELAINKASLLYSYNYDYEPEQLEELAEFLSDSPKCPFEEEYLLDQNGEVIPHEH